jgi:hypothetical protein
VFHKTRGISSLADDLLASQEGLCSRELVSSPLYGVIYKTTDILQTLLQWNIVIDNADNQSLVKLNVSNGRADRKLVSKSIL